MEARPFAEAILRNALAACAAAAIAGPVLAQQESVKAGAKHVGGKRLANRAGLGACANDRDGARPQHIFQIANRHSAAHGLFTELGRICCGFMTKPRSEAICRSPEQDQLSNQ